VEVTEPSARGSVYPFAHVRFRGCGEWAPFTARHLSDVKESSGEKNHSLDSPPLIFTMNEEQWPISMADFKELNAYLADHLPRTHKDDPWETVA